MSLEWTSIFAEVQWCEWVLTLMLLGISKARKGLHSMVLMEWWIKWIELLGKKQQTKSRKFRHCQSTLFLIDQSVPIACNIDWFGAKWSNLQYLLYFCLVEQKRFGDVILHIAVLGNDLVRFLKFLVISSPCPYTRMIINLYIYDSHISVPKC